MQINRLDILRIVVQRDGNDFAVFVVVQNQIIGSSLLGLLTSLLALIKIAVNFSMFVRSKAIKMAEALSIVHYVARSDRAIAHRTALPPCVYG